MPAEDISCLVTLLRNWQLLVHWSDGDYEYKLAETKTGPELRALLVNLTSVSSMQIGLRLCHYAPVV
jgi:hypothetical protein